MILPNFIRVADTEHKPASSPNAATETWINTQHITSIAVVCNRTPTVEIRLCSQQPRIIRVTGDEARHLITALGEINK